MLPKDHLIIAAKSKDGTKTTNCQVFLCRDTVPVKEVYFFKNMLLKTIPH